jgi:hypothetical protein
MLDRDWAKGAAQEGGGPYVGSVGPHNGVWSACMEGNSTTVLPVVQ